MPELFKGIPRKKISWYPTIDYKKCIGCGKCVEYCKLDAYSLEENCEKEYPVVKNPYNCVILCKGCQDICPSGAISHPSRKETVDLIRELRKAQS
jgi:NAD-dependent dihydropyrimidine dehydrogenase PreA subunit